MRIAIAALVATTAFASSVSLATAQDIGGRYRVEGTNFDGSRYRGTAVIEITTENTCRIEWTTGSTSAGICMRNQNALAAGYAFDSGTIGLIIYEILPDGRLEGLWTVADRRGVGTETLIPAN